MRRNKAPIALGAAICFLLAAVLDAVVCFTAHVRGTGLMAIAFGVAGLLWLMVYFRRSKTA